MSNLPIFLQSNSIKEKSTTPSTPVNLMPFFFAMLPQMASFAQNLNMNNSLGSSLALKQPILLLNWMNRQVVPKNLQDSKIFLKMSELL